MHVAAASAQIASPFLLKNAGRHAGFPCCVSAKAFGVCQRNQPGKLATKGLITHGLLKYNITDYSAVDKVGVSLQNAASEIYNMYLEGARLADKGSLVSRSAQSAAADLSRMMRCLHQVQKLLTFPELLGPAPSSLPTNALGSMTPLLLEDRGACIVPP